MARMAGVSPVGPVVATGAFAIPCASIDSLLGAASCSCRWPIVEPDAHSIRARLTHGGIRAIRRRAHCRIILRISRMRRRLIQARVRALGSMSSPSPKGLVPEVSPWRPLRPRLPFGRPQELIDNWLKMSRREPDSKRQRVDQLIRVARIASRDHAEVGRKLTHALIVRQIHRVKLADSMLPRPCDEPPHDDLSQSGMLPFVRYRYGQLANLVAGTRRIAANAYLHLAILLRYGGHKGHRMVTIHMAHLFDLPRRQFLYRAKKAVAFCPGR